MPALFRVSVLTALLIAALYASAPAADLEAGLEAVERDDYAAALREFLPLAVQGDALAQLMMGGMYADGVGVPQDDTEAVTWWRKAAQQGEAEAQYRLGFMYANGRGVPQDDTEAANQFSASVWYRRAAEQGHAEAQGSLGAMYANGQGVPKDGAEAAKWYRKAAEQGNVGGQTNLGAMLLMGESVSQDKVQAYAWLHIAAEQGNQGAKFYKKVATEVMTPEDISRAQQLAREYWEAYVEPFR